MRPWAKRTLIRDARDSRITKRVLQTQNMSQVAEEFGLTRERVRQIVEKVGIVGRKHLNPRITAVCTFCKKTFKKSPRGARGTDCCGKKRCVNARVTFYRRKKTEMAKKYFNKYKHYGRHTE